LHETLDRIIETIFFEKLIAFLGKLGDLCILGLDLFGDLEEIIVVRKRWQITHDFYLSAESIFTYGSKKPTYLLLTCFFPSNIDRIIIPFIYYKRKISPKVSI